MNIKEINSLVLAYLGDSIYELKIRNYLIKYRYNKVNNLQKQAMKYVTAKRQAYYVKKMLENNIFTQKEIEIIKRGRNAKSKSHPKNTDIVTYKWATSLEALFGYLYINEDYNRIDELINIIIGE